MDYYLFCNGGHVEHKVLGHDYIVLVMYQLSQFQVQLLSKRLNYVMETIDLPTSSVLLHYSGKLVDAELGPDNYLLTHTREKRMMYQNISKRVIWAKLEGQQYKRQLTAIVLACTTTFSCSLD